MRKPLGGAGARAPREPSVQIKPPLVINIVTAAVVTTVAASVVRALLLLGYTTKLQQYVTDLNNKAKKPDKHFNVAHAVHAVRDGALVQAAVYGVALLLLAYALRRSRTASGTRWAMLVIFVLTGLPFYIIPTKGLPAAVQLAGVVVGAAAIVAILLTFISPQSQRYFRDCRDANRPAASAGPARPGLGGLFGPKRPRGEASGGGLFGGGRTATARGGRAAPPPRGGPAAPGADRSSRPAPKSKAKVRSDSEAVAKGAELARSRAKASKSRRTSE